MAEGWGQDPPGAGATGRRSLSIPVLPEKRTVLGKDPDLPETDARLGPSVHPCSRPNGGSLLPPQSRAASSFHKYHFPQTYLIGPSIFH